jgi:hypothetical protein
VRGAAGSLYGVADTYPALGRGGVHVQPGVRLARALERPQMAPGGVLAVVASERAPELRGAAAALGLHERVWDNGTVMPETLA